MFSIHPILEHAGVCYLLEGLVLGVRGSGFFGITRVKLR